MPPRKRKASATEDLDYGSDLEVGPVTVKKTKTSAAGPSTDMINSGRVVVARSSKSKKGKEKEKKQSQEKRLGRYRSACPQNIMDRLDRALSQRFFLIHREREPGALKEEFTVSGSTGNVYTVFIDNTPSCNCPDALKGNHCKHIIFVFHKVLQVNRHSTHWYQKALLNSELQEIFDEAPAPPQLRSRHDLLADSRIVEAWRGATGKGASFEAPVKTSASTSTTANDNRRIPGEEDDCPICYDTMHDQEKTTVEALVGILVWCKQCGNALHKGCWENYSNFQRGKTGEDPKCVWCRAPWIDGTKKKATGNGPRLDEGYMNLAGLPGMEDVGDIRDTSTYNRYYSNRRCWYGGY